MSFSLLTIATGGNLDTIAGALAYAIANPSQADKYSSMALKMFSKARGYALGSTAKFFRLKLRQAFKENTYGWPENPKPLAAGGLTLKGLLAANPPRQSARKVKKARKRVLGGRLGNTMLHNVDDVAGTMEVGTLPEKLKGSMVLPGEGWVKIMREFQNSGRLNKNTGNLQNMRRYFGALGVPMSSSPQLNRPARPLFSKMTAQHPPLKIFEEKYLTKIRGSITN
jgi:hypothetical protein